MASTSQHFMNAGFYANGNSEVNGSMTATTFTDGTLSATAGDITGAGSITATTFTDGTLSATAGDITGAGSITATSFSGDGSSLTGITVSNISSTAVLTISDDGTTWTATTIPIGEAGILMLKCKTEDDACVCAVLGGSDGAIYLQRTAGTTSSTQLEIQEGITYYEVKYVAVWGGGISTSACNMTEFRQVIA